MKKKRIYIASLSLVIAITESQYDAGRRKTDESREKEKKRFLDEDLFLKFMMSEDFNIIIIHIQHLLN